jgi:hypothetical protein
MDVFREPGDRVGLLREVPVGCGGSVVEGSEYPAHIIDPYHGGASGTGVIDEQLLGFRVIRSSGPICTSNGRLPWGDAAVTAAIVEWMSSASIVIGVGPRLVPVSTPGTAAQAQPALPHPAVSSRFKM